MIIKGQSVAGAGRLATHLLRTDHNEHVEVLEPRGSAALDLRGALADMEALAAALPCKRPLYHASINTPVHEALNAAQRALAIDRLEAALGLTGQPRAAVLHVKAGREHLHLVWSRADVERGRVISDSFNYRRHEAVARELEQAFGHTVVPGVHVGRQSDGQGLRTRPARCPGHDEMQQGDRTGISPAEARAEVTAIWRRTRSGPTFAAALAESGWTLCRGDRRAFVLMDRMGGVHGLARRIEGATAKDITRRMATIDPASLLSVTEARAAIRASSPPSAELVRLRQSRQASSEIVRRDDRRDGSGGLYVTVSRQRLDYGRALMPSPANGNNPPSWTPARITGIGQFRAQAWLTTTPYEKAEIMPRPMRPTVVPNEPASDSGGAAAAELDGVLDSIAREVEGRTVEFCNKIMEEFATRIRAVRTSVPRDQAAGVVRALKHARGEAVRYASETAAVEVTARQKAARVRFRRQTLTLSDAAEAPRL